MLTFATEINSCLSKSKRLVLVSERISHSFLPLFVSWILKTKCSHHRSPAQRFPSFVCYGWGQSLQSVSHKHCSLQSEAQNLGRTNEALSDEKMLKSFPLVPGTNQTSHLAPEQFKTPVVGRQEVSDHIDHCLHIGLLFKLGDGHSVNAADNNNLLSLNTF